MSASGSARPLIGMSTPVASHGMDLDQFLAEVVEETRHAERVGFDFVLIPEHHTGPPSTVRSTLGLASLLLARTSTILVGTGVLLLPLHHPQHLVEFHELATHAYDGRFLLGVGVGYDPRDYACFGLTPEAAKSGYSDQVTALAGALAARSAPAGVNRPHWANRLALAAWSGKGLDLVASTRSAWMADPIRPIEAIRADAERLRRTDPDFPVIVMREAWAAVSQQEADTTYRPHLDKVLRYYERNQAGGRRHVARESTGTDDARLEALADPTALVASLDDFVARLDDLVELVRPNAVCLTLRQPSGPDHAEVLGAIDRVGTALGLARVAAGPA